MKGYKTIIFNAVMLAVGITGAAVDPELVDKFVEAFVAVLTIGNMLLRAITNSPIFSGKTPNVTPVVALLSVFLLMGCLGAGGGLTQDTGNPEVDAAANAVKRVGIACDSYSSTLNVLAAANVQGQLSVATVERVDDIVLVVGPYCRGLQPTGLTADDVIFIIEPLVYELLLAKEALS